MRHTDAMPTALALLALLAADPAVLAPTPADLQAALSDLRARLVAAESAGSATASAQNAWVESGAPGRKPCAEPADALLVAKAADEGQRWRDAAQAARASADRLRPMLVAPTIQPLLDPDTSARASALLAAVDQDTARYLEASAWQARYLAPTVARCPAPRP